MLFIGLFMDFFMRSNLERPVRVMASGPFSPSLVTGTLDHPWSSPLFSIDRVRKE